MRISHLSLESSFGETAGLDGRDFIFALLLLLSLRRAAENCAILRPAVLAERAYMAYQRGSLKQVKRKAGLMWILRYRITQAGGAYSYSRTRGGLPESEGRATRAGPHQFARAHQRRVRRHAHSFRCAR